MRCSSGALSFSPETVNDEERSVEFIAATEDPVPMPDYKRGKMVPEILLMSGFVAPTNGRVPLLDSHQRGRSADVIGSAVDLRVEGQSLVGRAVFSTTAGETYTKVKEGHLTDLSIGYPPSKMRSEYVPDGKQKIVSGKLVSGPANVVSQWTVSEISVAPLGRDGRAKFRSTKEDDFMSDKLRAACIEAGMPENYDEDQAQTWLVENLSKVRADGDGDGSKDEPTSEANDKRSTGTDELPPSIDPAEIARLVSQEVEKQTAVREEKSNAHRSWVIDECQKRGISEDEAASIARNSYDRATAFEKMVEIMSKRSGPSPHYSAGPAQIDKHREAISTAVLNRSMGPAEFDRLVPEKERAAGWEDFRYARLIDVAKECLRAEGMNNVNSLGSEEIVRGVLGDPDFLATRGANYGYHTTGMFPRIMADSINKNLRRGYTETPMTWRMVFRQAASVPDFKSIKRIQMSDAPNIDMWDGIKDPNEMAFRDEQESYAVECYSNAVSIGYKTIVNDDLDALSRIPMKAGAAMARTINAAAWAQVTSNPTMQDSQALFLASATGNRFKANYTSSGSAPSVSSLQTGRALMRLQVGANVPGSGLAQAAAQSILNIVPRYIVGPAALETTIMQLVRSAADPAASHAGTYNTATTLMPVIEPLLDADSTTAWYLFADTNQIDTIEVSFLQGQEMPLTRRETDFGNLSQRFIILQTFAAKAIDFRGCYKGCRHVIAGCDSTQKLKGVFDHGPIHDKCLEEDWLKPVTITSTNTVDGWTRGASAGGTPTLATVDGDANGAIALTLDDTSEAQVEYLYWVMFCPSTST